MRLRKAVQQQRCGAGATARDEIPHLADRNGRVLKARERHVPSLPHQDVGPRTWATRGLPGSGDLRAADRAGSGRLGRALVSSTAPKLDPRPGAGHPTIVSWRRRRPPPGIGRGNSKMGRIVVTEYISVDGVVEAPSGTESFERVGWTTRSHAGPRATSSSWTRRMASDALLLGRVTYDGFAPVWPHFEGEFADKFNTMPKYVVSSTLENPEWNNTTVLRGDIVEEVTQAQAAVRAGHRRPWQPAARADADRARPRRCPAPAGLPRNRRRRQAPLQRNEPDEAATAHGGEDRRRRRPHSHLREGRMRFARGVLDSARAGDGGLSERSGEDGAPQPAPAAGSQRTVWTGTS